MSVTYMIYKLFQYLQKSKIWRSEELKNGALLKQVFAVHSASE